MLRSYTILVICIIIHKYQLLDNFTKTIKSLHEMLHVMLHVMLHEMLHVTLRVTLRVMVRVTLHVIAPVVKFSPHYLP